MVHSIAVNTRNHTTDVDVKVYVAICVRCVKCEVYDIQEILETLCLTWKQKLSEVLDNDISEFREIMELLPGSPV